MNITKEYRCEGCQSIVGWKMNLFTDDEEIHWFEHADGSCEEDENEWRMEVHCRYCNRKNHFIDNKISI